MTLALTTRWLGPEGRGTVAAATAWAALLGGVASLSLGQALQHRLQTAAPIALAVHSGTLLMAAGTLGALGGAASFATYIITRGSAFDLPLPMMMLLALFMPVFVWEQFAPALSALANTISALGRLQTIMRSLAVTGLLLLAWIWTLEPWSVVLVQWCAQLAIGVVGAYVLWRAVAGMRASLREFHALLPSALKLHATTISALLLDTATVLLVNEYLSKSDVGLYQLAQQMIVFLLILPQIVTVIITARVSHSNPDTFWPLHRRVIGKVSIAMVAIALIAYWLAPFLVRWLAGAQFATTAELFRMLLPSLAGLTLSQLLAPQWISRGIFGINAVLTIGAAVLMLVGTVFAIEQWGIQGAAWARTIIFGGIVLTSQLAFVTWLERNAAKSAL